MNWKEIFKTFVCLLLICCLVVNMSPLRAEAVSIELGMVVGLAAIMILNASGVIYLPSSLEEAISLGESMKSSLQDWASTSSEVAAVESFLSGLSKLSFDKSNKNTILTGIKDIAAGLVLWIASMAKDGITTQEKVYDFSLSSYYGLPSWDIDAFPYFFIYSSHDLSGSPKNYTLYVCDAPITYLGDNGKAYLYSPWPIADYPTFKYIKWTCDYPGEGRWKGDGTVRTITNFENTVLWTDQYYGLVSYYQSLKYSNFPIYDTIGNVRFQGDETSVLYVDVPFLPGSLVGDVAPGLADGSISPEELTIPDSLELGGIISSNDTVYDDMTALQEQLISGDLTFDEYFAMVTAEKPVITQDLDTTLVTYNVGDAAVPLSIAAAVSDGGTLTYQWYRWKTGEAVAPRIEGAVATTYTPPTDVKGKYHYYCMITNTNAKGLTSITTTKQAVVEVLDPALSGDVAGTTSGTFINELVDSLVSSVDALSATQEQAATVTAQGYIDDFLGKIPDHSGEFLESLDPLVTVLKYEGTDAIITMPAITIPAVGGMIVQTTVLDEQTINFKDYFEMMPQVITVLVHAFFDIAVIVYCSKEFLELLGSVASAVFGFHREEA